jgi:FkbM family methyltransferase
MMEDFTAGRLYESETSHFLGCILAPCDAFIDIGAHVGYFSMLASTLVGPTGRVYSFEPETSNHAHLLEHIELNGATNIIPNFMAVGAAPGIAQFHVNADNDGGHALWDVGQHPFNERSRVAPATRRVCLTSLDHYFAGREIGNLKAIKIDAEGAEFSILSGARDLLERSGVPFIIAEVNRFGLQHMGTSEGELRGVMSALGYETYLFQPGQMSLTRLTPEQSPDTNYVFNILFRHPEAPAIAA